MDRLLSDLLCLKRRWTEIPIGAMSAGSIVIDRDISEYGPSHARAGNEALPMYELNLDRVKEALGAGIIVTTPFRAHTARQTLLSDQRLVGRRAILTAAV